MNISSQDPSEWARVSPYLDQALDLEPPDRVAWLEKLAATHPQIAASVRELLAEHAQLNARGFLSRPPLLETPLHSFMPLLERMLRRSAGVESGDWLQERPGPLRSIVTDELAGISADSVVGNYRLLREIGSGGMSWVWLAERSDGLLKREVALKLSCEGPRRAQFAERFNRERNFSRPSPTRTLHGSTTRASAPPACRISQWNTCRDRRSPSIAIASDCRCMTGSAFFCRCSTQSNSRTRISSCIAT